MSVPNKSLSILFLTSQWPTPAHPSVAPFVKREVDALGKMSIAIDVFVYSGGWSPLKYWHAIRKMHRQIKENRYDLIHVRFGQCAIVARCQLQLPIVITYGGSDVEGSPYFSGFNRYKNWVLITVSRFLSLIVDDVIVVSDHLGKKLWRSDYHVISSGVDFDLFQPHDMLTARQRLGLPTDKKLVLFVGDPQNARKRYGLAAEACEIVGATLELELIVLANKPAEEVPWYMNACDVLVLTSTNEGSPNVIKEALACKLPIVATNVGDVSERLALLEGCIVCKDDDSQTIADGLIMILTRGERLSGSTGIEALDSKLQAEKVIAVYRQVLAKRER